MRALTYHQPWATATALGWKGIETRSRPTGYRGPLLIHAGQTVDHPFLLGLLEDWPEWADALRAYTVKMLGPIPVGVIVARARLASCRPAWEVLAEVPPAQRIYERYLGDFSEGRWGWRTVDIELIPEPVECRGFQGLWAPPRDVVRAVEAQLGPYRPEG